MTACPLTPMSTLYSAALLVVPLTTPGSDDVLYPHEMAPLGEARGLPKDPLRAIFTTSYESAISSK